LPRPGAAAIAYQTAEMTRAALALALALAARAPGAAALVVPPPPGAGAHEHAELAAGLAAYASSLGALATWEACAAPALKRRGLLPDVPAHPGLLSEAERAAPFLTPLTCDRQVPPPALAELRARGRHFVGRSGRVAQYITAAAAPPRAAAAHARSAAWTAYYGGAPVLVYKEIAP